MKRINTWSVLIIASIMVIGQLSSVVYYDWSTQHLIVDYGICIQGYKYVELQEGLYDMVTAEGCIENAQVVEDCPLYDIIDHRCYCEYTELGPIYATIGGQNKKACVPKAQRVLFSQCTKTGSTYACSCPVGKTQVDLTVTSNPLNPDNLPKGCSQFLIPNCKNYKLQKKSGSETIYFTCNQCESTATLFTGNLILDGDLATTLTSKACPAGPKWWADTCEKMKLTDNQYECVCDAPKIRIIFPTQGLQTITQGCVDNFLINGNFTNTDCQQNSCNYDTLVQPNAIKNWTYTPKIGISSLQNRKIVLLGPDQQTCIKQTINFPISPGFYILNFKVGCDNTDLQKCRMRAIINGVPVALGALSGVFQEKRYLEFQEKSDAYIQFCSRRSDIRIQPTLFTYITYANFINATRPSSGYIYKIPTTNPQTHLPSDIDIGFGITNFFTAQMSFLLEPNTLQCFYRYFNAPSDEQYEISFQYRIWRQQINEGAFIALNFDNQEIQRFKAVAKQTNPFIPTVTPTVKINTTRGRHQIKLCRIESSPVNPYHIWIRYLRVKKSNCNAQCQWY